MVNCDENVRELLAKARAIHLSMQYGALSYQEAKKRTQPLLQTINTTVNLIAKKYQQKPKYISFTDLARNL